LIRNEIFETPDAALTNAKNIMTETYDADWVYFRNNESIDLFDPDMDEDADWDEQKDIFLTKLEVITYENQNMVFSAFNFGGRLELREYDSASGATLKLYPDARNDE